MAEDNSRQSSGLPGLDQVLMGFIPGDNVVWQVVSIEHYREFVVPLCQSAQKSGQKLTYFRFAKHAFLVPDGVPAEVHQLYPEEGFETFITEIHEVIEKNGCGGFYVFDSLSELALDCYSDRMVGNFFMLTCPYLLNMGAVAYFAVLRHYHSFHAAQPIAQTTQLLIDVYRYHNKTYIHPRKVMQRYSPTIHMLHERNGDDFRPITQSSIVSEVLTSVPWPGMETPTFQVGVWNRVFFQAEEVFESVRKGNYPPSKAREVFQQLLRMVISREPRVLAMAEKYLTFTDLLCIRRRMIGTGFLGGKSVGMLLSRAVLLKEDPGWEDRLEPHDSFYIASEVFYTYLILNNCWWIRKQQRDPEKFLQNTEEARRRILHGRFPDYIIQRFENMLEYFGQSPYIVRSSSLLEDNYGNMFAGKYESVYCSNQGNREQRLEQLMEAVRIVYASSMGQEALLYRARHGILDQDEQMALLVQRVSGAHYGHLFYPQLAGVGFSFNPYVWTKSIDPDSGVVRLVFGLGTRAVALRDDDYTRLIALNAPQLRPENGPDEIRRYSQKRVDVLNLESDQVETLPFDEVIEQSPGLPAHLFSVPDSELEQFTRERGGVYTASSLLSFDYQLNQTPLVADLKRLLKSLEKAYQHPVDIEFTVNYLDDGSYRINLLQCRHFQVRGIGHVNAPPENIAPEDTVFTGSGAVVGTSRSVRIERLIYIVPQVYGLLPMTDRYSVARLIGKIIHLDARRKERCTLLAGPGRWGTTTPSLGIPVCFAEIDTASVLCELVQMREGLVPDVSLGTHFFSNLVESDILYTALFPEKDGFILNSEYLMSQKNRLLDLFPSEERHEAAIRVLDFPSETENRPLWLHANCLNQSIVCHLQTE
ncbi:MAG: pyruvate, phosphate dikinase [Candidatus Omnitrophica bacterium]|nr:pyruvate, phosphate dikinase [bacterium]MCC6732376.1 pyruvate, phosphate dikinase [Candidatus Omnitrophota bacterium]MBV6482132.1 hypothetical protein [bacterium]MCK6495732.1 PEP/pyruvate-binding domain-containing protein [bacterium]MCL4735772.1 pyruvate, phosphate dikinase [Candidatus Omnitrophota bacterium]